MEEQPTHTKSLSKNDAANENGQVFQDLETNTTTKTFEIENKEELSFFGERNMGTSVALFFVNGEPLITIGPNCKFILLAQSQFHTLFKGLSSCVCGRLF